MLVMMVWVILTLVEVHTNDHAATSNYLVDPHIVEMKYINSLVYALEECYNNFKVVGNPVDFRNCAFAMLEACTRYALSKNLINRDPILIAKKLHMVTVAKKCIISRLNKRNEKLLCLEACFLKCYEDHLKEHGNHFKEYGKKHGGHKKTFSFGTMFH